MNTRLPLALMFGSIILSAAPAFADGNCAKEWSWGGCAITSRSSELNLKAETYADASESFVDSSDPRGVTADGPLSFTAADPAPMPSPLPNPVLDHHQIYLHNSCSCRSEVGFCSSRDKTVTLVTPVKATFLPMLKASIRAQNCA